jgi:ubiquinone/menaquinone biosynthesis C-methylase UbiE
MNDPKSLKRIVQNKYAQIAKESKNQTKSSCCAESGASCCQPENSSYSILTNEYNLIDGYVATADLNLGCGIPTKYAAIKSGDTVLDLGSGAGNDVFVARSIVGEHGKVIGIDMTPEMIDKARDNNQKLGYANVEFHAGDIENLPVADNCTDVVISNCVLNLVPDKRKAFDAIYRVLKAGAHFCISDIVSNGQLTESIQRSAELYTGCVAGALLEEEYVKIITASGFTNIEIKTKKRIYIPVSVLQQYVNDNDLEYLEKNDIGIFSITVVGNKP